MIRNTSAAFGGRPVGSVFFVSAHLCSNIINVYGYSLHIPYIFHTHIYIYIYIYIYTYIMPKYVPCNFPCVFLNLWSQD